MDPREFIDWWFDTLSAKTLPPPVEPGHAVHVHHLDLTIHITRPATTSDAKLRVLAKRPEA